ncbi:MAG TPA: GNAT family N-acetyltransferase [Mycobacteriales bacterium]|nr:GNAT family N-acetyltransferase [Mycobacteriales bacterium]
MSLRLQWVADPDSLDDDRLTDLVSCWTRVSNAGGAVGFPFLPVEDAAVVEAAAALRASLDASHRLLLALHGADLAGWLTLRLNTSPLTAHWGVVSRVQTDLEFRGLGNGRELMTEAARMASSLGLEQLHIAVRSGQGIEGFYANLGWQTVGRWPSALRLGPRDDRDEVFMMLRLPAPG